MGDGRVSERVRIDREKHARQSSKFMRKRRQITQRVAPESQKQRADELTVRPRHTFASKTEMPTGRNCLRL